MVRDWLDSQLVYSFRNGPELFAEFRICFLSRKSGTVGSRPKGCSGMRVAGAVLAAAIVPGPDLPLTRVVEWREKTPYEDAMAEGTDPLTVTLMKSSVVARRPLSRRAAKAKAERSCVR